MPSKSVAEFELMFNKCDNEVTELMLSSESKCNKFVDGTIKFSPVVGLWIDRLRTYHWIIWYKQGQVYDPM